MYYYFYSSQSAELQCLLGPHHGRSQSQPYHDCNLCHRSNTAEVVVVELAIDGDSIQYSARMIYRIKESRTTMYVVRMGDVGDQVHVRRFTLETRHILQSHEHALLSSLQFTNIRACILHSACKSVYYFAIYRPPPSPRNGFTPAEFLSEFDSFVNSLNSKLIIAGDYNLHVDDSSRFLSASLTQHVIGPAHDLGHTFDLVIHMYLGKVIILLLTAT